jgi:hypothetical protein
MLCVPRSEAGQAAGDRQVRDVQELAIAHEVPELRAEFRMPGVAAQGGGMSEDGRISLLLWRPQQAHAALQQAWVWAKAMLVAGHRLVVEMRVETRSDAQNRLLHSRFNDISKQLEWAGKKRDTGTWKRLLVAGWLRARGEHVEILPAIDGHGVDVVFRQTSKLTRKECAELSDYVMAWGSSHEPPVRWCIASLGGDE